MVKRLAYIVLLLIFAASLSSAKIKTGNDRLVTGNAARFVLIAQQQKDTVKKKQPEEDPKKIKEISKAKRQAKPEKIGDAETPDEKAKAKRKRERRPEGLDRPPEIPRRNN